MRENETAEFQVAITYGEERERTKVYSFDTEIEMHSFITGLCEAVGWMDFKVVGERLDVQNKLYVIDPIAFVLRCNESWECQEYEEIEEGWTDRNLEGWVTKDEYVGDCFIYNLWDHDKQEDQWMCKACQSTNVTVTEVSS